MFTNNPLNMLKKPKKSRFQNTSYNSKTFGFSTLRSQTQAQPQQLQNVDCENQKLEFRKFERRKREMLRGLLYNQKSSDMKNVVLPRLGTANEDEDPLKIIFKMTSHRKKKTKKKSNKVIS